MKIKKWSGTAWVGDSPDVGISNIIASGTPGSTTYLRGDGQWATISDANNYVSSVSLDGSNVLTLNRQGLTALTVDLSSLAGGGGGSGYGLKLSGTITANQTLESLFEGSYDTNGIDDIIGSYWVVTAANATVTFITTAQTHGSPTIYYCLIGDYFEENDATGSFTLERHDWLMITSYTGSGTSGSPYVVKFSVINNTYTEATATQYGIVRYRSNTAQSQAANSLSATAGRTYAVQKDSNGDMVVNVPWVDTDTNTTYTAGTGLSLTGTVFANTAPDQTVALTGAGSVSVSGTYPNFTITGTDTNTTYGIATSTTAGLVEVFSDTDQTVAANAVSATAGRTYGIQLNSANQMVVNVPWVDTNTTYTLGSFGITSTAAELNYTDGVTSNIQTQLNGKLSTSGKAADSELLDGIDSSRVVYGSNSNKTNNTSNITTALPSGFYDVYGTGAGAPTETWYTVLNARHTNESNNHGGQIAMSFYSSADVYTRYIANGSYGGWTKMWTAANDGSGSGLDADLLDGYHVSGSATANTVVIRDGNNYIYANYINSNRGNETSAAASYIYDSGDGWMRKKTLANARTEIVTSAAVIAGLGYTPYNSTNPNGYTTNTGTVTSVATGGGLTGGTITSTGTISHADTSGQASVNNSGNTFVQDITLDTYGHVTGITSATATGGSGATWELIRSRAATTDLTATASGTLGSSVTVSSLSAGDTIAIEVNSTATYTDTPKIVIVTIYSDTTPTVESQTTGWVANNTSHYLKNYSFGVSASGTTIYFDNAFVGYADDLNSPANYLCISNIVGEGTFTLYVGRVWRIV